MRERARDFEILKRNVSRQSSARVHACIFLRFLSFDVDSFLRALREWSLARLRPLHFISLARFASFFSPFYTRRSWFSLHMDYEEGKLWYGNSFVSVERWL